MNTEQAVLATLEGARALITHEQDWIKGNLGSDMYGKAIHIYSDLEEAVCYCAEGAVLKVVFVDRIGRSADTDISSYKLQNLVFNRLLAELGGLSVHRFNDRSTHAEVLAIFDTAIEKARAAVSRRDWEDAALAA